MNTTTAKARIVAPHSPEEYRAALDDAGFYSKVMDRTPGEFMISVILPRSEQKVEITQKDGWWHVAPANEMTLFASPRLHEDAIGLLHGLDDEKARAAGW